VGSIPIARSISPVDAVGFTGLPPQNYAIKRPILDAVGREISSSRSFGRGIFESDFAKISARNSGPTAASLVSNRAKHELVLGLIQDQSVDALDRYASFLNGPTKNCEVRY
jgi:hypothetical protein